MKVQDLQEKSWWLAKSGLWIFPCKPGRKEPLGGRGFHDASNDAAVVRGWWDEQPDCNIGLHLGKSGLFALDIEVAEHEWLDRLASVKTFIQATANGGWHYVFRQPEGLVVPSIPLGQLDDVAEIKGDGGYILLAPSALYGSVAKLGMPTAYRVVCDASPCEVPEWLLGVIEAHIQRSTTERVKASGGVRMVSGIGNLSASDRVAEIVATVRAAPAGSRSNTLISAAASLGRVVGGGYISHGEAVGILEVATVGAGWESPKKTMDTIRRGIDAGLCADPWFPDEISGLSDQHIEEILDSLTSTGLDGIPTVEFQGQIEHAADAVAEASRPSLVPSSPASVSLGSALPDGSPSERDAQREELAERVAQLSGITADFMDLARQCAIYWQPGFAIGGAIALGGVLGARRLIWGGRNPLTTSCYVLIAGGSGDGKSTAKAPVDMCLEEWPDLIGGNSLSSFQANFESIRTAAESGHGQLWVLDEYYKVIESMTGPKASSFNAENRGLLLEMATINAGTYRRKKSKMESRDGHQFEVVHAPGFGLMALSASERLFGVLGRGSVGDGYLPRHLLFLPQAELPRKSRGRQARMSHRLRDAIGAARDTHKAWVDGLGTMVWQGVPVEASDEARAILSGFGDALDAERRVPRSGAPEAVLARGEEHAIRVAMCLGSLAQAGSTTIRVDAEIAYLACDIVAMSCADVAFALREHTSESPYEAHLAQLRRHLAKMAGPDGWVKWSTILSKMRVGDASYIGRLLNHLVQAEEAELSSKKNPKGGPEATVIRLAQKGADS